MTHNNQKPDFEDAISALRGATPDAEQMQTASERVWSRLNAAGPATASIEQIRGCADVQALLLAYRNGELSEPRRLLIENHVRECAACSRLLHGKKSQTVSWVAPATPAKSRWGMRELAIAATVLVVIGVSALALKHFFSAPAGMRVVVQSVDGNLYRVSDTQEALLRPGDELAQDQLIRTGGDSHAFLRLYDGSIVEMNERSEFSVSAQRKDTTVRLEQGRIIVQAAKRRTGHLYVLTPDARVSVTGTVFSVNSGLKGSRVSVIQGEVHVLHAGINSVLHAGDQVATSASISAVPVRDEIAWSRNLDKHLALLSQFSKLQRQLDQIPMPGLRYSSAILSRVPSDTMVYAAMPNLGEALSEANRIFQQQLQESPELREWWDKGKHGENFERTVEQIHVLGQYLGDEVVLLALPGQDGSSDPVLVSEVRRDGLREYLQGEFGAMQMGASTAAGIRVVDGSQLASLSTGKNKGQLLAVVRSDLVLFSSSPRSLQRLNAQLDMRSNFLSSEFGQRISSAYSRGAAFLFAVDMHRLIQQGSVNPKNVRQAQRSREELQRTGFGDARYLLAEHREVSGVTDNRAVLDFASQRHGIASWLAEPAPMGSLEYVSANASIAISVVAKSPALMMDDLMAIIAVSDKNAQRARSDAEAKLGISFREDVAASFGGDTTFALDGPLLPSPAWKFIAQVNDSSRLQAALQRFIQGADQNARQHGRPGVQLSQQDVSGRTFYVIRSLDPKAITPEFHYTFTDGYMVAAPSRALVMNALQTKANDDSLVRSSNFQSMLPRDEHANASAVFYQNLAPVVQPIASQLSAAQLQALQEIAADAKPALIFAYGSENSIEVASGTQLLPFTLHQMAISAILGKNRQHR